MHGRTRVCCGTLLLWHSTALYAAHTSQGGASVRPGKQGRKAVINWKVGLLGCCRLRCKPSLELAGGLVSSRQECTDV